MALAFVLSCLLAFLPSAVGMAVVRHAGVDLSGPQGSPPNDDPIYYRWDEGLPGTVVRVVRLAYDQLGRRSTSCSEREWVPAPGDLAVWEIDDVELSS